MKKIIIWLVIVLVLVVIVMSITKDRKPEAIVDAPQVTFSGTLPCADCMGIEHILTMVREDAADTTGSFTLTNIYLGVADDNEFVQTGTFSTEIGLGEDAAAIVYVLSAEDGDQIRFLRTANDTVELLDIEGNRIESSLNYTLTRI